MRDEDKQGIAYGIGAALGVFVRLLINLGMLWVNLWVLNHFGWLPF